VPHWGWDLVALAGWPVLFALEDKQVWLFLALLTLALYIATFRGALVNRVFRYPVITLIGGMCYSIYLFHYVLIPPVIADQRRISSVGPGGVHHECRAADQRRVFRSRRTPVYAKRLAATGLGRTDPPVYWKYLAASSGSTSTALLQAARASSSLPEALRACPKFVRAAGKSGCVSEATR